MQHPLLDDDGDGTGSNALSDGAGDGVEAEQLHLGVGVTNASLTPADLKAVTPTLYLDARHVVSHAVVRGVQQRRGEHGLVRGEGAGHGARRHGIHGPARPRHPAAVHDAQREHGQVGGAVQRRSRRLSRGRYEVYYFTKSTNAEISQMQHSVVYKDKAGNNAPDAFGLVSPADSARGEDGAAARVAGDDRSRPGRQRDLHGRGRHGQRLHRDRARAEDLADPWYFVESDAGLVRPDHVLLAGYGRRPVRPAADERPRRSFHTNNTNLTACRA